MKKEHAELRYPVEPYKTAQIPDPMQAEDCQGDTWLGDAYDLQVWCNADTAYKKLWWGYVLADPAKPKTYNTNSYTFFSLDPDGNLSLLDDDVVVTTAHLAEIYRCVSDHMDSDDYVPLLHIGKEKD